MTALIRPAEVADAERLAPLHTRVWLEAYAGLMPEEILDDLQRRPLEQSVERWRERIAWPHGTTWVAEDGNALVGFVSSGRGRDGDGDLEVMALYVRRSRYDTGLGHRLLVTAIGDAPAYLWVLDGNTRAIRFYERHGFVFDGKVEEEREGLHRRMARS
jgi:ribosomal protein S18 acetylase RimI-like enzyme